MGKKNPGAENIRVIIRVRDLLPAEAENGDKALVRLDLATNQVIVQHQIGDPDVFAFDAVYNNSFTQRDVFLQEVQPLADAVMQGYNATVFAYGQSGSGKTFTMTGDITRREMWGMMPQVVDHIFSEIKKLTSTTKTFKVKVSYVELYNGKASDLLTHKKTTLEIKQNMSKNFYVKGAEMPEVTSLAEAMKLFEKGTLHRQTASTGLNDTSSRSHSLFTVQIEQFDFENDPSAPIVMTSKINVVDLAGSERLSKTNATGDTAKEGCNINLSLSALATVIDTIVKGGKHIPYRGSPLTMLLKDSLGGNAKTAMFANCGPSDKNLSETISTLRFALRAKQIENKPLKNMDPKDARIQDLMDQIEELKKRLGNVDLNVEDDLRQRIEELEIENSDLRSGGDKQNIELEEQCRSLQVQIEEKEREVEERQRELRKEMDRREIAEVNLSNETSHFNALRTLNMNFIKRICTDEQLAQLKSQMPTDGSYNITDENWDVREIGFYLNGFAELYEGWRRSTYTQQDMEKYAARAMADMQEHAQRQINEAVRARDDIARQRDEEAARRTADSEAMSQLRVDLHTLREENTKLREKIERDQEKIKARLAKSKEEYKALQDQLEVAKGQATEKDRDIERLKRMLEDAGGSTAALLNRSGNALFAAGGLDSSMNGDERAALLRQLEEERHAKTALEGRIKETNVALRRYGVCIADPQMVEGTDAASAAAQGAAFVLAAVEEEPIDGDVFAQLQQQMRTKQRLTELAHQQQMRLDDMIRKYELLKTGQVTANSPSPGVALAGGAGGGALTDEATAQQIRELLQRKEDEIDQLSREKDATCDKLVKKLNKSERKIKELEAALEEERAQLFEERGDHTREAEELQRFNQSLAVELETARSQLEAAKEGVDSLQRAKEAEAEYFKLQLSEMQARLDETRNKSAEFDEMSKSYERLQQHTARLEQALNEKSEHLESNRQTVKWANSLLEQEKQKCEDLESTVRQQELELRRMEEAWRAEAADQVSKQVAANNRRLEAQATQFQQMIAEEQAKQRQLHKKLKSAKSAAQKVAQRYDEMILENEVILSKVEELKIASMKMYLEKQEIERDLQSMRPTSNVRARVL